MAGEVVYADIKTRSGPPHSAPTRRAARNESQCPRWHRRVLWISGMLHIISVLGVIGFTVWVSEVHKMMPQKSRASEVGCNSSSSSTNCRCPSTDWMLGGGNCYYISSKFLNWSRSHEDCSSRGSHLAVIQDQAELDFISSKLKEKQKTYAWIGLFNLTPGWYWTWVNGSTLNIQMFSVLSSGDGPSCAMVKNSKIESETCTNIMHWICQKKAQRA